MRITKANLRSDIMFSEKQISKFESNSIEFIEKLDKILEITSLMV